MASPNPYPKRRSPPSVAREPPSVSVGQPRSYHTRSFLCKFGFFALCILALPLFPSQAPDFVGETVLTKFWELIHLLFVGIAVSYGLFSRRNADLQVDLQTSHVEESSQSYVSGMLHFASFFDYGSENSCEFDVKNENCSVEARIRGSVLDEEKESGSFVDESQLQESFEYGKFHEFQAWNSQCFQRRSKVVVTQPAYALDDYIGYKPLGLPVRSLKTTLGNSQAPEDSQENEFGFNLNGFSESYEEPLIGGSLASAELEEKFDEVGASSSPVSCHSRSQRVGMKENVRGGTNASHFRPLSVDESQFESMKSRSFRSTASSSSQASLVSLNQSRCSPAHSASAESLYSNMEEFSKEKSFQGSSRSNSPSPSPSPKLSPSPSPSPSRSQSPSPPSPKTVTDGPSRPMSHSRHYSYGSLLEEDVRGGFEEGLDGLTHRGRRAGIPSRKELGSRPLKLNAEYFSKENRSRRSYPPDSVSPPIDGEDFLNRRRSQQNCSRHLLKDYTGKSWEEDRNNLRGELRNNSLKRRSRNRGCSEPGREGYEKDESFYASSSRNAESPLINSKSSRSEMHSGSGSRSSLLEKDLTRNSEDDSGDLTRSQKGDPRGNKESKSGTLRWEPSSGKAVNKVSLRGKSVRTIRPGRHGKDIKREGEFYEDWPEAEAERRGRTESRRQGQENESNETILENLGHASSKPKQRYLEDRNDRAKQSSRSYMSDDPEENEAERPRVSMDEESARESVSDGGHGPNEVDRKAGEFIAKFREQIRLQKLTSGELPRGIVNFGVSHLR